MYIGDVNFCAFCSDWWDNCIKLIKNANIIDEAASLLSAKVRRLNSGAAERNDAKYALALQHQRKTQRNQFNHYRPAAHLIFSAVPVHLLHIKSDVPGPGSECSNLAVESFVGFRFCHIVRIFYQIEVF